MRAKQFGCAAAISPGTPEVKPIAQHYNLRSVTVDNALVEALSLNRRIEKGSYEVRLMLAYYVKLKINKNRHRIAAANAVCQQPVYGLHPHFGR